MSDYPMLISNKLHSFRNFLQQVYKKSWKTICSHALINDDNHLINNALYYECIIFMLS
jgi:hypothetical protein